MMTSRFTAGAGPKLTIFCVLKKILKARKSFGWNVIAQRRNILGAASGLIAANESRLGKPYGSTAMKMASR